MYVLVNPHVVAACHDFASRLAAHHKANPGLRGNGQAVKTGKDIYSDVRFQTASKAGEAAGCMAFGLDPLKALNWSLEPDGNTDFMLRKWSVDVKASDHPRAEYLIWPKTKNHVIEAHADVLMLVLVRWLDDGCIDAYLPGYVTRKRFPEVAKISRGIRGITDGQYVVHKSDLTPVEDIINYLAA